MAGIPGGIQDVPNSRNSIAIDSLARFAVEDCKKRQNALLEFGKVVSVKEQVVAGTMYYITLEATDGGKKKIYETKIWEKPWLNYKEVQQFKPVDYAPAESSC
ncbi:hypothetical protein QN277_016616 [Acacia crassicarpa]|uniref:Cysteine proteinase inhibitor n=1 Tax=Acacia crassicarpa TaxID=499986 RepID=A0AAE1MX23_9FABA|nr:hypothetical protein QN277_016616 [Acacia crassicarpa]